MKGGISVLVGALLVVFSLTMVAEAQRKNRIRGNQGRRSVGKPGTTIQQKRKGQPSFRDITDGTSNTLRRDDAVQPSGNSLILGGSGDNRTLRRSDKFISVPKQDLKGQPSMILDDTTNPSLRDNGGVERNRRKRR